jgi:hypothetical protein
MKLEIEVNVAADTVLRLLLQTRAALYRRESSAACTMNIGWRRRLHSGLRNICGAHRIDLVHQSNSCSSRVRSEDDKARI